MTLRSNGSYIGYNQTDTSSSATGVWSLDEVSRRKAESNWPLFYPGSTGTVTLTEDATPTLINLFGERSATNNTSSAYGVTKISFTPSSTGTKTLYVGFKIPVVSGLTVSTFYHDYTIAGIQLQQNDATVLETYQNATWTGFQTSTNITNTALTTVPTTNSYSNIGTGTSANRFNIDSSGTGSSSTGNLNGINTTGAFATSGGGTIAQSSSTSYLYVETSGATIGGRFWMRKTFSTSLTSGTEYHIYLVHYLNTINTYTTDQQAFQNSGALYIT